MTASELPRPELEPIQLFDTRPAGHLEPRPIQVIALVGNPNSGKTTLFNRLTGARARTSNFPGTTLECRGGRLEREGRSVELIDLPGLYSTVSGISEERLAQEVLRGGPGKPAPDAILVVVDATRLDRHLYLASELRELGRPMLVALSMIDEARQRGLTICLDTLARELDARVVPVSGRTGEGVETLARALVDWRREDPRLELDRASAMAERIACRSCSRCPHADRHAWACEVGEAAGLSIAPARHAKSDRLDRLLTHPLLGPLVFSLVMGLLFVAIFRLASWPMDLIDGTFGWLGASLGARLPAGIARSFLVDGVLAGVGGVLVFLPQICLLFFLLSLLEDTGYLARAAFVADRLMQRVGLPGKAFVPLLSAHACAIPAILATRSIETRRDRLVTILVIPLLTCSARLPVYAMVAALLFAGRPVLGGLLFTAAYLLGIVAALAAAFVLGRSLLPGSPQPLVIELPPYRRPSLRVALLSAYDRARVFLRQAGTVILLLSMLIWVGASFPRLPETAPIAPGSPELSARQALLTARAEGRPAPPEAVDRLSDGPALAELAPETAGRELERLRAAEALRHSFIGRLGQAIEPVFAPLGFDWRISVGVLSSFAAREVLVSSLSIVAGLGEEGSADQAGLTRALQSMRRPDGRPLFDLPTSLSLLVFFVLAMQCLPTQAVTRRETGSWSWPALQLVYMSLLAYGAALVTYWLVGRLV